ncbi:BCCT family transporter [Photobacterium damselae subsp. damselae]|uniref:BCCT family transporter n=2 Tax=Photobacterium damselae subsp. damselae TaxID=85581 RepID=A0AAD3WS97_PHODD|nr:BCCT family transporter [Photobacterium damselae]KAB1174256.1 BCCT family transporter [Photobacterium damselae subsp. damselae]MCG3816864.1 BCCT family transporter [Photobacterium damselae]MDC4169874.1 BCCT family transporter [Photobacterium damselae]QAY37440.1 BCCT family transporter [Photobacterium damselae subsp. damselae]QOQ71071.1 BCCT family transporter [Photobacterium damselae subsp. damselae]
MARKLNFQLIDRPTFFGALGLLISTVVPLLLFPKEGAEWIAIAKSFMTDKLGFLYLGLGVAAFFFMIYIVFSDIGQIKLGDPDEAPEFKTASWAAMLFCGGIGASILYWGAIEWAYYYQSPPFQLEPGSEEAVRWAATYGIFHWGPIAWSIYLVPALPIAYFFYVRKQPVLKVSAALMPVIGEARSHGWVGKLVDVLFIFGLLGGGATTLGLAAPLITEGVNYLFGVPKTTETQVVVLLVCTAIFAYSAYAGMEKGIKLLSNINFWGALGLLAFILICGPTIFMLETGLDSLGRMLSNFFVMATWAEPFGGYGSFADTHFPQDWTIFYWAWWLVFAPSMGLFVARISRGRTIKQMVTGSIFFGSMGCFLFFMILGNYGLSLQLSGALDVVGILNAEGATKAIFSILEQLPFSTFVIAAFTVLCLIFTATTFDSISYILASVVQNNVTEEPMRWNRLFWAFALSFMPSVLLFMGGLSTLQTAAIVGGLPLLVIAVMLMVSAVKAATLDLSHQEGYEDPTINIEELPDVDPWSKEGMALAKFEQLRDAAIEAADAEREALNAIWKLKKKMRAEALSRGDSGYELGDLPQEMHDELEQLTDAAMSAKDAKLAASEQAQEARVAFNDIMKQKILAETQEQTA